jgi:predicted transcriptional regulator
MTFTFKAFIESVAERTAPGPSTTFKTSHIFYALELMSEKPIGRNRMAKMLDVGEGAVRTIIGRLKQAGLVETAKEGCRLTEKGQEVWKTFAEHFPARVEIGKTELVKAEHSFAFLIKNSGCKVSSGIEQRDAAIVAGAQKAVIIVCKKGRLVIESVSDDVEAQFPKSASQILKFMAPKDNDVVILVGAGTLLKAKHGAFAASWVLLDGDGIA